MAEPDAAQQCCVGGTGSAAIYDVDQAAALTWSMSDPDDCVHFVKIRTMEAEYGKDTTRI